MQVCLPLEWYPRAGLRGKVVGTEPVYPQPCPTDHGNGRSTDNALFPRLTSCQAMARYRPDMAGLLATDPSLQIDMARVQVSCCRA
jgi:hypothetical protein